MQYPVRLTTGLFGASLFFGSLLGCGSDGGSSGSTGGGGADTTSSGGTSSGGGGSTGGSIGGSGGSTGGSGGSTTTTTTTTGGSATGQWVLGYYVGYQLSALPIADIDWSGLTHIAFAPLLVNDDHTLDFSFYDEYGTGEADAKALSDAAHAHGVTPLLMLGGMGAGPQIASASTPANRGAFVTRLLDAMTTLGYDGIDIDWEENIDYDDLAGLAHDLRAAKPDIVLSYPAGCVNGNYQTVEPKLAALAESLDRFNVQSYFPSTALAGFGWESWFNSPVSGVTGSTPIAIDDTLQRYEAAGIPRAKLGMGMSFYAICYTGGITGPHQATDGNAQQIVGGDNNYPLSLFFAGGHTFDASSAAERKVDATAQVPYLSLAQPVNDSGCGASTRYISYDDEASILAKGAFSKANGYGGIIVWTIQEGWLPPGAAGGRAPNALFQALKQGFLEP